MPLERDINIALNGPFWVEVANPEHPFTAMLISCATGTCLIRSRVAKSRADNNAEKSCIALCAVLCLQRDDRRRRREDSTRENRGGRNPQRGAEFNNYGFMFV